ncbi:hypothetical protein [Clostridium sp.]|uniref:DUF2971 domain-containing protein n=1 Tax=Clostridium sp. TaxID=1506 RepID=UPI002FCA759D
MANFNGVIIDKALKLDTKLYRYMSLSQFISFIEQRKTYLTKLLFWEDTWEVPTRKLFDDGEQCLYNNTYNLNDLYGQCWSLEGVSDALWRIYSRESEGILIQTTVEKFQLIEEVKFGVLSPVIYYENLVEVLQGLALNKVVNNDLIQGLFKRKAFEHEKEVRLIALRKDIGTINEYDELSHIEISLDPIEFIEDIVIDPRAQDWYVNTIKEYCKRAGFKILPKKSDLYCSEKSV